MMVLDHGQYYSVSLCKEKYSIQLDIILEKNTQSYGESRKQLIDFFLSTLEQTCHVFMPASSKPVAYTPCPHCNELHIKYRSLLEERPHLCNMMSVPSDYYQDLFKDTQGTPDCLLCCYYVYASLQVSVQVNSWKVRKSKGIILTGIHICT